MPPVFERLQRLEASRLFHPTVEWRHTPVDIGLEYENIELRASDGTRLSAWFLPKEGAKYYLLFMHGNAGNMSDRVAALYMFNRLGLAIFIFDYRGYGKSEGQPREKGLYQDTMAAYEYLTQVRKIAPDHIVIFGESLGGATAIDLASKVQARALITAGTFSNIADIAKLRFPNVPVHWFLTQRFDSISKVPHITMPKFFLHSKDDEMIPFELAKKLYEAAAPPKEFFVRSGRHSEYSKHPAAFKKIINQI